MSSIMFQRADQGDAFTNKPPLLKMGSQHKNKWQWLRRWRRRWKVRLGALRPRDALPPAECASKAGRMNVFAFSKNGGLEFQFQTDCQPMRPKWVPNNGPCLWSLEYVCVKMGPHCRTPFREAGNPKCNRWPRRPPSGGGPLSCIAAVHLNPTSQLSTRSGLGLGARAARLLSLRPLPSQHRPHGRPRRRHRQRR